MQRTGHERESVYRRYAIVSAADPAEGVARFACLYDSGPDRNQIDTGARRTAGTDASRAGVPNGRGFEPAGVLAPGNGRAPTGNRGRGLTRPVGGPAHRDTREASRSLPFVNHRF